MEYQVIVRDLSEIENPEVYGNIVVSVEGYDNNEVNTFKNKIEEGKLEVKLSNIGTESIDGKDNVTTVSIGLMAQIKNISDKDLENVTYILNLPSEVSIFDFMTNCSSQDVKVEKEELVDKSVRLKFSIPKIKMGESEKISFFVRNNSMDYTKLSTTMVITSYAECEDEVYNSNDYIKKIYQGETKLECKLTSDVDSEYVENGQTITFVLNIKNIGFVSSGNISVSADVPDGLEIANIEFDKEGNYTQFDGKKIRGYLFLDENEEENLRITTKVNEKLFTRDQSTIEFGASIVYGTSGKLNTNIISYKINNKNVTKYLPSYSEDDEDDKDNNDNQNQQQDNQQNNDNQNQQQDNQQNNNNQNQQQDNQQNNNNQNQQQNNQQNNNNQNQQQNNQQNNNNQNQQQNNQQNNNNQNQQQNNQQNSNNQNQQQDDQQNNNNQNQQQNNLPVTQTYKISGLAWVDKNQDGIRQEDEELKEAVVASLYKSNSNGGIDTTKLVETTSTDNNGKYIFEHVENGKYIIVFDYNSTRYKVTKYQVKTAKSSENSDVVSKTVTINGNTQILGVTDVLTVNNMGLTSIDIGIIDTTNYDFSLEKRISEIKVKNDEETKTYNYDDKENKRLEIHSKYYKSTVLDITYKFKVKNEGDVEGYINKIVDYLPEGVQVVLNKSEGWYIGADNGLYYTGLIDEKINPNQEKEFTLVLRKSLEDGEAVKLVNGAEIIESTNSLGLLDKDSIENNKVKTEDDYGEVTLTVSISTGHTIEYITTTLITIIMFGVITTIIMKFIKTKKVYK